MVILDMKVNNIYMFDDFEINFTFPRKLGSSIIENEFLFYAPKIKYKKVNIIMGANASGKTTFGNLLCNFENYICAREGFSTKMLNNKNKPGKIEIIFSLKNRVFQMFIKLNPMRKNNQDEYKEIKISEGIKSIKLNKSYNYKKVVDELNKIDFTCEEFIFLDDFDSYINSKVLHHSIEESSDKQTYTDYFKKNGSYYYKFASFNNQSKKSVNLNSKTLLFIEKILKIIDNSVDSLRSITSSSVDNKRKRLPKIEDDYYVIFKNGDKVLVPNGEPKKIDGHRLSQGTIEAIEMSYFLSQINNYSGVLYMDEQMAYMHTNLANELILKMIKTLNTKNDYQLFITSHDQNILDLNIPIHSFVFFVRNNNEVTVVHPENKLNKNDRKLIEYVQNNYFDTIPNLDKLWDLEIDQVI